ncbi:unnamed protein product, partial [Lymnaea stagnalis]
VYSYYHLLSHLSNQYLALIDIINVTLALPALLYLTIYNHTDNFNETCIFLSYVALWTATLSGDVLILIAVDRYLKLCLLRRTGLGEPLIKKLFALIILVTSGMYVPIRWIFGKDTVYMFSYNVRITYCYIRTESKLGSLVMPFFTLTSSTTAATMTLFVVLYFQIIRKLRELSGKNEKLKSGREDDTRGRSQREAMHKSSVVFIVITAVFFFSYVLYYSTVIVSVMDPLVEGSLGPSTKAIFDLAKFGPLINHVTNPFIYGYSSARFRNEVVKIITFKAFDRDFFKRR